MYLVGIGWLLDTFNSPFKRVSEDDKENDGKDLTDDGLEPEAEGVSTWYSPFFELLHWHKDTWRKKVYYLSSDIPEYPEYPEYFPDEDILESEVIVAASSDTDDTDSTENSSDKDSSPSDVDVSRGQNN